MLPSPLALQLQHGLADFLRASFGTATPGFAEGVEEWITRPEGLTRGPYVSVRLPFVQGGRPDRFPRVPLAFPPHAHQDQAWQRLEAGRSTLVATGTGSGKTECFLWPILAHCEASAGTPGIKAILLYPMNALATDQAGRIARTIHTNPHLKGHVTAGLYVGEDRGTPTPTRATMGPDHVITDRDKLRLSPPDILLTNYKMLDFLLQRPRDAGLWTHNVGTDTLRFVVVDEIHTFDGAQGTDLACLLRRLKARLRMPLSDAGHSGLVCVGTSATLGGDASGAGLRTYAEEVFGEPFDEAAVIGEQRQTIDTFLKDRWMVDSSLPSPEHLPRLDPRHTLDPERWLLDQVNLWFPDPPDGEALSDGWRVSLGERLTSHTLLGNLLRSLDGHPRHLHDLVERLARQHGPVNRDRTYGALLFTSFLGMISAARSWLPELDAARTAREAAGGPRPVQPFLQVQVQLWQRELARVVASVSPNPRFTFVDDLERADRTRHLPVVHCRVCHAMGWATVRREEQPHRLDCDASSLYDRYFRDDPRVQFLWPAEAVEDPTTWGDRLGLRHLHVDTLTRIADPTSVPEDERLAFVGSSNTRTIKGRQELHKDCPFCQARGTLALVGFRATMLTSTYVDQLFASRFQDHKKLLAFSDSVQDAAHRAGFLAARTWRINLRLALAKVAAGMEGAPMRDLPDAFVRTFTDEDAGWDPVRFASTFIAHNMLWMHDWDTVRERGEVPDRLMERIHRRLTWEIFQEIGLQAPIGRSLVRTGTLAAGVDVDRLHRATTSALPRLRAEQEALSNLDAPTLQRWLLGLLHHLRNQGAILHPAIPDAYLADKGKAWALSRDHALPGFAPSSRKPVFLTDAQRPGDFEPLIATTSRWLDRWFDVALVRSAALRGDPVAPLLVALDALTEAGLVQVRQIDDDRVWGLTTVGLTVTTRVMRSVCDTCGHIAHVSQAEAPLWAGMPCTTSTCGGHHQAAEPAGEAYFARLYRSGDIARVFASEHTGLLARGDREAVESAFQAEGDEARPWDPNLLSCTPTLEMGINIGDLSTAMLCNMPPTQASYLQRIGRAGRRDGNALVVGIALARPHDLYFYAQPTEMIEGEVTPPGVFLGALAVLERQLTAFCLDAWVREGVSVDALPATLGEVLSAVDPADETRFPHTWMIWVEKRQAELLHAFCDLFPAHLSDEAAEHLRRVLEGTGADDGSLTHRVLEALHMQARHLADLGRRINRLKDRITAIKARGVDDEATQKELEDLRQERLAVIRLRSDLKGRDTLGFFTDEGLVPNYAFPEAPVRLHSVIFRKRETPDTKGKTWQTWSYEYARPAMSAIRELAPANDFYAGGRKVRVDQVDLATAEVERWRFCDACDHHIVVQNNAEVPAHCPACNSPMFGDPGQERFVRRMRQVYANTPDHKSRIGDESDNRSFRPYNTQLLIGTRETERLGAWRGDADDAAPFAFEHLRNVSFTEINFGRPGDDGSATRIGGRESVRRGFTICNQCGKVQPDDPEADRVHDHSCPARTKNLGPDQYQECVYLYRQFRSEAVRMLLPFADTGIEVLQDSFVAALRLGLRERFGGQVDHLDVEMTSEPDDESTERRRMLVLYDKVPGGSGYLKDLVRDPDGIFEIFAQALDRLERCECFPDDDRDGCYRCLFAWRSARHLDNLSSESACRTLRELLRHRGQLVPIEDGGIGKVSIKGMLDSVLEQRFIEALRRCSHPNRRIRVDKARVHHLPGFRMTLGAGESARVWLIRPQLEVGPADGLPEVVSIDFVFHPPNPDALPIAVFLDGLAFHQDRVRRDLRQREALRASGRFDVWTFTWDDVSAVFDDLKADEEPIPWLRTDRDTVPRFMAALALEHRALARLGRPSIEWFLDSLMAGGRDPSLHALAQAVVLGQCGRREAAADDALNAHLPEPVAAALGDGGEILAGLSRPRAGLRSGLVILAGREAATPPFNTASITIAAWFDDGATAREHEDFKRLWNGLWRLHNLTGGLTRTWMAGVQDDHPAWVDIVRMRLSPPGEDAWALVREDLLDDHWVDLLTALHGAGCPVPEAGWDLQDPTGRVVGLVAELAWPDHRLGIVEDDDDTTRVDPAWTLVRFTDATPETIAAHLREGAP